MFVHIHFDRTTHKHPNARRKGNNIFGKGNQLLLQTEVTWLLRTATLELFLGSFDATDGGQAVSLEKLKFSFFDLFEGILDLR